MPLGASPISRRQPRCAHVLAALVRLVPHSRFRLLPYEVVLMKPPALQFRFPPAAPQLSPAMALLPCLQTVLRSNMVPESSAPAAPAALVLQMSRFRFRLIRCCLAQTQLPLVHQTTGACPLSSMTPVPLSWLALLPRCLTQVAMTAPDVQDLKHAGSVLGIDRGFPVLDGLPSRCFFRLILAAAPDFAASTHRHSLSASWDRLAP